MDPIPREFAFGGVYFPPWLVASLLGMLAAWLSALLLNRLRLSRFFAYLPLVFRQICPISSSIDRKNDRHPRFHTPTG